MRELAGAVASGAHTVDLVDYADPGVALTDLRNGRVNGVLTIPPDFSRRMLAQATQPRVALISDNTDTFVSATLAGDRQQHRRRAQRRPVDAARGRRAPTLDVVEVYPYVPYIQYLLPGSITMSIFMMVMIGGGIIFIDDKARGLHEGYLVTPITKLELVAGFNISGTIKAVLAGVVITIIGSLIAGVPNPLDPMRMLRMLRRHHGDGVRADQPDVPADGARHRSADAARDVRRAQHRALLPERRRLSAAGLPAAGCRRSPWSIRSPTPCTRSRACCSRTPASRPSPATSAI